MQNHSHSRRGFTLVEILVSGALVALLVGLLIPGFAAMRMNANRIKCASNMRQIGLALLMYANENDGCFPPTTHTTGAMGVAGRYSSWIYQLAPYLGNVDEVRVCPADKEARKKAILQRDGLTSYVLNDIVFDPEDDRGVNRIFNLPVPSQTMMMFIVSNDRDINRGWDHAHCGGWTSWHAVLADIEPDRHRVGERASDRLRGSSNYLYADAHVENIPAVEMRNQVAAGKNPAAIPLQ